MSLVNVSLQWLSLLVLFVNKRKSGKIDTQTGDLVVTSIENHQKIHLFQIIKILNKFKIFKYHRIIKFSNNIDLRKLDFLSE